MVSEKMSDEEAGVLARDKFPIWEACGADGKQLADIASRTSGPLVEPDGRSGWTTRFMMLGDQFHNKAISPAIDGQKKTELYSKAALYYGIARFPATETPLKQEAYAKQISALAEGSKYCSFTFSREQIPYGGKNIIVNCYMPLPDKEITLPEAVLLTGGTDETKEDLHTIAVQVVNDGMACMTIDLPGTGESAWKLKPPGDHEVYSKTIKYLAGRGDVDPARIGMFGISFGGYWSLVAASTCPEIKAAVNCGGPVHRAFSQEKVKRLPDYRKVALAHAMGYDLKDVEKMLGMMEEFSLFKREDLRRISCPLLSIDGSDDPYVPIEDLFMISEEGGVKQEEWVYREDVHCAPKQFNIWMPRAVVWIANKIGGPERIPRPDLAQI